MRAKSTFVAGLALGLGISTVTGLGWSQSHANLIKRQPRVANEAKEATDAAIGAKSRDRKAARAERRSGQETRVYPVADLVVVRGKDRSELISEDVIELIQNIVHPNSWTDNGGEGAIEFFSPSFSFAVSQTPAVHAELETLFADLRKQRETLSQQKSGDTTELATLTELILKESESSSESHKLQLIANTMEYQKTEAELRRIKAEADLAERRLEVLKTQQKRQARRKDSDD